LWNVGSNQNQRSDVGDQELLGEDVALELDPKHRADAALRAIASDQIFAPNAIATIRCLDFCRDFIANLFDAGDLVLES